MQIYYKSSPLLDSFSAQTNIHALFQQAVQLHQRGQLTQAQFLYDRILSSQPKHAQAIHLKGVLATQTGQFARAVELFNQAIQTDPAQPAFYCNRGNALLQMGEAEAAVVSYDKAVDLDPNYADAFANRGAAEAALGRLDAAVVSYLKAIELNPNHGMAYYNSATALHTQGQLEAAVSQFDKAISLKGDWYEAHCGRGRALQDVGRLDEAIATYDRCISINPNFADAHFFRGNALRVAGELDLAIAAYEQAIALKPNFTEAHGNLGDCLCAQSRYVDALGHYIKAILVNETVLAKAGFARCVRHIRFSEATPQVMRLMVRAISEAWIRPSMLFATALSLIQIDPDVRDCIDRAASTWPKKLGRDELFGMAGAARLAEDELLQCVLRHMAVPSIELEHFLTSARFVLLDIALQAGSVSTEKSLGSDAVHEEWLDFFGALAYQCFVNDYAFADSDAELAGIGALNTKLTETLANGLVVPDIWVVALAAYGPLGTLKCADRLKSRTWHKSVDTLITLQIDEPTLERHYRSQIPVLTDIDDSVSDLVRDQYENSPYPRWVATPFKIKPTSVDAHLRALFPKSVFESPAEIPSPEILIAGCGTGQQSIEAAQNFLNAKVVAIDLSATSLAHAMRKTAEHGLQNIHYAQADILKLAETNKSFDIFESVVVLHHLSNPMEGWKVLTQMLRPGGFMRLGFYSELARRDIVKAQQFATGSGYRATAKDIRQCRQDLMSGENMKKFGNMFTMRDFFSTSECRDLLFHVQEHRYTIPKLRSDLAELGLSFLGFLFNDDTHRKYVARFPDDVSMTNLDNWHVFELEQPDTFISMYQFWAQKSFQPSADGAAVAA